MATLLEEFNAMKIKIAKAQATGDVAALNKKIHIIDHEAERERKIKNPDKSTRVVIACRTPDAYAAFQKEKERFFDLAVDPHIAIDLLIRALHETTDDRIRSWLTEGETAAAPAIPDWMKP
jgi:hypothetical protein